MRSVHYLLISTVFLVLAQEAYGFSLKDKTVLVTGSAAGIGKGIAELLAEKGAKIILHYNIREEEAHEFATELGPNRCLGVLQCDFRDISTIPTFFKQARDLCGKIDVLVNNAGAITKAPLDSDDDSLRIWRDTLAVNLDAPNLLGKLFAEQFEESSNDDTASDDTTSDDDTTTASDDDTTTRGVILNVGSIHGSRSNEYMGAYAASKAGLESLTRTMSIEYATRNIRANLIAPGFVPVERTETFFRDHPEALQGWTDQMPLKMAGSVKQVAEACLPLLENEWITGTVWQIDGGMMARANMPKRPRP